MHCPVCHRMDTGKVGSNQFYCSHCFVEFNVSPQGVKLYYIDVDGSLVAMDEILKPRGLAGEDSIIL